MQPISRACPCVLDSTILLLWCLFLFGYGISAGTLYRTEEVVPRTLAKDIREVDASDLAGLDAVVHMGELSNDPAGELAPNATYEINHQGSVHLAKLARKAGVRRFVYMSSCSVYGVSGDDFLTEDSSTDPQTAYAVCKNPPSAVKNPITPNAPITTLLTGTPDTIAASSFPPIAYKCLPNRVCCVIIHTPNATAASSTSDSGIPRY